jgi:hypothetical protein
MSKSFIRLFAVVILVNLTSLFCSAAPADEAKSSAGRVACAYLDNPPELTESDWELRSIESQFNIVRDLRTRLEALIPSQKNDLADRTAQLTVAKADQKTLEASVKTDTQAASSLRQTIDQIDVQLTDIKARQAANPNNEDAKNQLGVLTTTRASYATQLNDISNKLSQENEDAKGLPDKISSLQKDVDKISSCSLYLQSLTNRAEQRTLGLLIPTSQKSSFRLWLSFIYAGIVLVLIGGFYGLAFIDAPLRTAIFGRQAGIQFITLFSLVIAIILFGVLEILADKELAALLGGISGYILGRVSSDGSDAPVGGQSKKSLSATSIGFVPPDTITDSSGRLGMFAPSDHIEIAGSQNNDGVYTVLSTSSGSIMLKQKTIQTEPAGSSVQISALS